MIVAQFLHVCSTMFNNRSTIV